MADADIDLLRARIATTSPVVPVARVCELRQNLLRVAPAVRSWSIGDRVEVGRRSGRLEGEIVVIDREGAGILTDESPDGVRLGDWVEQSRQPGLRPNKNWMGRILDPFGRPLDGRPLVSGMESVPLKRSPPLPASRKRLGQRLETGMRVFNTLLPLVKGQRIGLFAGSGVGKSTLLGSFARHVEADVIVIALIGERGRELRDFAEDVLGSDGLARSVIVAATSDQSPLIRRRCAWAAMAVAEYFRDRGQHVLLLADSVTRLADAHREIALSAGELPGHGGYPASMSHLIMSLAERSGPGSEGSGDITAVFSVLVAGSDMEGPVADVLRGVLDGHVVMDREIAERGRYPAINLLRSVSRSLPAAASDYENRLIAQTRLLLGAYDRAEMMIQAGLYVAGSDPVVDAATRVWPALDGFLSQPEPATSRESFAQLETILGGTLSLA